MKENKNNEVVKYLLENYDIKNANDWKFKIPAENIILDDYDDKEIDIDDFAKNGRFKLDIIEEPKKLILKPKNIKH